MTTITKILDAAFPGHFNRGALTVVLLAAVGLYGTLLIKQVTGTSINRYPEALFTLLFLYAFCRNWSILRHDPGIKLLGLSIALPILFLGINYLRDPVTAMQYESLDKLVRLMLFIPVAWWLGGHQRNIMSLLGLAFLGLLIAVAMDPDLMRSLQAMIRGRRVDFGILNAQHVALYFSVSLIGFLSFGHRAFRISRPTLKALAVSFVICGGLISLLVIMGTQTRASWIALVVCATVLLLKLAFRANRQTFNNKKVLAASLISVILLVTIGSYFKDTVTDRLSRESGTIAVVLKGDFDNIPYTSLGVRLNTWMEAAAWVREKPLTGWGGSVRRHVIQESETLPDDVKRRFGHFHNSYIEFTLAYGLLGLFVILATYIWLLRQLVLLNREGKCPTDVLQFTGYTMLLVAIMNTFESYLFFWSGAYVSMIMLAPAYTMVLKERMAPGTYTHSVEGTTQQRGTYGASPSLHASRQPL